MHKRSCLLGKGGSKDSSTWSANLASTNNFHGISKLQCIELGVQLDTILGIMISTWHHLTSSFADQVNHLHPRNWKKSGSIAWPPSSTSFTRTPPECECSGVTKSGTGSVSKFELTQSGQWVKVPGMHSNWVHGKYWNWWTNETLLWILYESTWLNREISDTHFLDAVVLSKPFKTPNISNRRDTGAGLWLDLCTVGGKCPTCFKFTINRWT